MFPNYSYYQISLTFCQISLKIWAEKSFSGRIAIWSAFYSKFVTFDASEKLRKTSENPYDVFYGSLRKTHPFFRRDPQFERFEKIYCSSQIPRLLCKHFFELTLRNVSKRTNCRCRVNEIGKHWVKKCRSLPLWAVDYASISYISTQKNYTSRTVTKKRVSLFGIKTCPGPKRTKFPCSWKFAVSKIKK